MIFEAWIYGAVFTGMVYEQGFTCFAFLSAKEFAGRRSVSTPSILFLSRNINIMTSSNTVTSFCILDSRRLLRRPAQGSRKEPLLTG